VHSWVWWFEHAKPANDKNELAAEVCSDEGIRKALCPLQTPEKLLDLELQVGIMEQFQP
jgi:hypothetical protein